MATRLIEDGTWNSPQPTGPRVPAYPFEGDDESCYFDQRYQVKAEDFTKGITSSEHPTATGFYLVSETNIADVGGGVLEFTRRYSTIPVSRSEFEMFSYNFIGYMGTWGINVDVVTGRERFVQSVLSRVQFDYYLVDPFGVESVPDHIYTDVEDIPLVAAQSYKIGGIVSDYLYDAPPFALASVPSRTSYEALVTGGSEIVAEESVLRRWQGNIWERITRYVKAK